MSDFPIKIVSQRLTQKEFDQFIGNPFDDMVKFVACLATEKIALGGSLHADAEAVLLDQGLLQANLWGGNIYPDPSSPKKYRIEYTSMINIRPSVGNRSVEVKDLAIRAQMDKILAKLLP